MTLLRIRHVLRIRIGGVPEPLPRLIPPTGCEEAVRVRVEEAGGGFVAPGRVEVLALQRDDRGVRLVHVTAGARDDDRELGRGLLVEHPRLLRAREFEGAFRPAQAAFAVRHHGEQAGTAEDAPRRPELPQGLRPFTGEIRHDPRGLAHDADAPRPIPRSPRVGQRTGGVLVDQCCGRHDMTRHHLGVALVEGEEVPADLLGEIRGLDLLRDGGLVDASGTPSIGSTIVVPEPTTRSRTAGARTAASATVVRPRISATPGTVAAASLPTHAITAAVPTSPVPIAAASVPRAILARTPVAATALRTTTTGVTPTEVIAFPPTITISAPPGSSAPGGTAIAIR